MLRRDAIALDVDVMPDEAGTDCPEFLSELDLPESPGFADWLTAARRRVRPNALLESDAPRYAADRAAAAPPNERRRNSRWRVPVLAGVVLIVGTAAWVQVARSRPVTGFHPGDAVLLADISNETGDTLFDSGILTAASIALQQSGHLRLYARTRLSAVYQRMQIKNQDTALTYDLAQEVAQRDNVRFVLGLRLFRDAGGYRITARLADVQLGGEVSENSEAAEREGNIIAALGRVLLTVRKRLGESRAAIRERQAPLPLVTTASLEALRRYEDALRHYRKANELDSLRMDRNNVNHEWGGAYVLAGRVEEGARVYQRMLGSDRLEDRALGMRSMGYLALSQGQLGRAIDFFSQASDAAVQLKQPLSEGRSRMLLVAALRAAERIPEAHAQVTRAVALTSSQTFVPQALVFVAFGSVRLLRFADADSMLQLIRSRANAESIRDRAAESLVAAALLLARQKPDSAMPLLDSAATSPSGYVMSLRAEAFSALGARDSARVTLERLIDEPIFGFEGQEEWQNAPFTLGTLLEAQGDTAGAVKAYRNYLERWRDAPAALPRLVAARARLAALAQR
ncbi:MAG: hypothetical protein ACT4P6_04470 [Gemmatimonadaceae bacterium]